jgi:hypothetical protein
MHQSTAPMVWFLIHRLILVVASLMDVDCIASLVVGAVSEPPLRDASVNTKISCKGLHHNRLAGLICPYWRDNHCYAIAYNVPNADN